MIEYSNDGFGCKERKEYDSKEELVRMLNKRFNYSALKPLIEE